MSGEWVLIQYWFLHRHCVPVLCVLHGYNALSVCRDRKKRKEWKISRPCLSLYSSCWLVPVKDDIWNIWPTKNEFLARAHVTEESNSFPWKCKEIKKRRHPIVLSKEKKKRERERCGKKREMECINVNWKCEWNLLLLLSAQKSFHTVWNITPNNSYADNIGTLWW